MVGLTAANNTGIASYDRLTCFHPSCSCCGCSCIILFLTSVEIVKMKNIILFACLTAFIARVSGFLRPTRTTTTIFQATTGVKYGGLHHCGILVRDVGESKSFYMVRFSSLSSHLTNIQTSPHHTHILFSSINTLLYTSTHTFVVLTGRIWI